MMAIPEDMIGIAWTNGIPRHGRRGVARSNRIGNNPVAFAAPSGARGPIVLDMALSVAAGGRVRLAAKTARNDPARLGASTATAKPTDDPAALTAGGALLPLGYKGYGLAVFGEILCGVLTGSNILDEIPQWFVDTDQRVGNGHVHLADRYRPLHRSDWRSSAGSTH